MASALTGVRSLHPKPGFQPGRVLQRLRPGGDHASSARPRAIQSRNQLIGHRAVQRYSGFGSAPRERATRRVPARALVAGRARRTQVGKAMSRADDTTARCSEFALTCPSRQRTRSPCFATAFDVQRRPAHGPQDRPRAASVAVPSLSTAGAGRARPPTGGTALTGDPTRESDAQARGATSARPRAARTRTPGAMSGRGRSQTTTWAARTRSPGAMSGRGRSQTTTTSAQRGSQASAGASTSRRARRDHTLREVPSVAACLPAHQCKRPHTHRI